MFGKRKAITKTKNKKTDPYVASPVDLILGIDFKLIDNPENKWVEIELLKGKFAGIRYKYNEIGIEEDPKKTKSENLHMKMDYTILDYSKFKKSISKDSEFNNVVFNVVYAILQVMNSKSEEPEKESD